MAVSESFQTFISDQLHQLQDLSFKRMFGGCGLYANGYFFAILADDRVYFKTDEETKQNYIECGMKPFQPSPSQTLKNYFEVPVDVLEDAEQLCEWALQAIAVSKNQQTKVKK